MGTLARSRTRAPGASAIFPMGTDAEHFERLPALAAGPGGTREAPAEDWRGAGCRFLGVDRLDYTKGIRRAAARRSSGCCSGDPELRGKRALVQIAVPSREQRRATTPSYRRERRGDRRPASTARSATRDWVPIHYLHRTSPASAARLYRARRRRCW